MCEYSLENKTVLVDSFWERIINLKSVKMDLNSLLLCLLLFSQLILIFLKLPLHWLRFVAQLFQDLEFLSQA